MKKKYRKLDMEIIEFDTEDVITTSTELGRDDGEGEGDDGDF